MVSYNVVQNNNSLPSDTTMYVCDEPQNNHEIPCKRYVSDKKNNKMKHKQETLLILD
jgi:hypothetical protein